MARRRRIAALRSARVADLSSEVERLLIAPASRTLWVMSGHDDHPNDGLRADLGRLVRELLEETPRSGGASLIGPQLRAHLGIGEDEEPKFPVFAQELEGWELPNLKLALDAAMARAGWAGRVLTP